MPATTRTFERRMVAGDAAVVGAVALVVAAGAAGAIPLAITALLCFLAVLAGGASAGGYGRACTRAVLAASIGVIAGLYLGLGAIEDPFDDRGGSAPDLFDFLPLLAALALVSALTALTAYALTFGWRSRNG